MYRPPLSSDVFAFCATRTFDIILTYSLLTFSNTYTRVNAGS